MSEDRPLSDGERELVDELSGLVPAPPSISEQAVWFEAGLRKGQRQARLWAGAFAAAVMVSCGIAVFRPQAPTVYVDRHVPGDVRPHEQLVATSAPQSPAPIAPLDYVRLRDSVERHGVDALSETTGSGAMSQPVQRAWSGQSSAPGPWDSFNTQG